MHNVISGNERIYTVYSDGNHYRYEFDEDGMEGIVIVYPEKNETHVLFPSKKLVHNTACDDVMSRMNDPVQAYYAFAKNSKEKSAGEEKVEGKPCAKKELYQNDKKMYTMWFSEELNFPVKMKFHLAENTHMVLKDIQAWKPDASFFTIPGDYTKVDEKMRPVIPEPTAPENWNSKEASVPFNGAINRGTRIKIKIKESVYHKLTMENNQEQPAKIIRHIIRNGTEISDSEQGPVKYRTTRIHGNESKTLTLDWKAGDVIVLEVFEGTMNVNIYPE